MTEYHEIVHLIKGYELEMILETSIKQKYIKNSI